MPDFGSLNANVKLGCQAVQDWTPTLLDISIAVIAVRFFISVSRRFSTSHLFLKGTYMLCS